jgi:hypothetical protein
MSEENQTPENLEIVTREELEQLGGEKLDGSGFENETPDPDWR